MKIKIVNGDDTRLWRYKDKYNFVDLNAFITASWDVICGAYIIQYRDDENDLMTIASSLDLNDALEWTQSQSHKSLKLYVRCRDNAPKALESSVASFRVLALDFLNNKEMKTVLSQLFAAVVTEIIGANITDTQYRKYAKYLKLRKIKMPQQSIMNKMKWDGFTQCEIDFFIQNIFPKKQCSKKYAKYMKMRKIKAPEQSIRNKMKIDGFSHEEIEAFFQRIKADTVTVLKSEEIIGFITSIINASPKCAQHPLYVRYGNVLVPFMAETIFAQQSVFKYFKLETLQKWFAKLWNNVCDSIAQSEFDDFERIRSEIGSVPFPLDTDYGKAIHFGMKCNECQCAPIVGERYKCSICAEVNLCEKCEKYHNPRHPLVQFKKSAKVTSIVGCKEGKECVQNKEEKECGGIECICGAQMEYVWAKTAYNWCNFIFCDFCDQRYDSQKVYHCPIGRDVMHKEGYDICVNCVSVGYGKELKALLL